MPRARVIRDLMQGLARVVALGVVQRVDDTTPTQELQVRVLAGETRARVQRIQSYGFSSVPEDGAGPAATFWPGGNRSRGVAVAVDDERYRPRGLPARDVVMYDARGNRIHFKDGLVEITAVEGLRIAVTGDVEIDATGSVTVSAGGDVSVSAGGSADVEAGGEIRLGGAGGQPVARQGDMVSVAYGSSAGMHPIVTGSAKVTAT